MVLSLKTWQKILSLVLVIVIVIAAMLVFFLGQKECCLCSTFRYHAPCLIDTETGDLIELDLYFPDDELVAELEDPQPEFDTDTFSFVKLGNVSGTKLTGSKTIELHIPNDKTAFPSLCKECKKQLPVGYTSRYVFADLHGTEEKFLIPIAENTTISLRCYELSMKQEVEKGGISVVIQGTLENSD